MKIKNALRGLAIAVVLQMGMLAGSAQTNIYLFSGSETNITLPPGTYIITAYGAPGGGGGYNGGYGALGAEMSGEFSFSTPTTLTLLVGGGGGAPIDGPPPGGGGGGGGSFVSEASTPLVIAGGGGGGGTGGGGGGSGRTGSFGGDGGGNSYGVGSGGGPGEGGGGGEAVSGGGGGGGFVNNGDRGGPFPGSSGGGGGGYSFKTGGNGGFGGFGTFGGYGGTFGGYGGTFGGYGGTFGGYGGTFGGYGGIGGYGGGGGGGLADGLVGNYGGGGGGGGGYGGGGGGYGGGGGGYGGGGGGYGDVNVGSSGGGGGSIIDSSAIAILTEVSGIFSPDDYFNGEIIITAVPTPLVITTHAAFGFTNGVFGFNVIGPVGSNVVIEASTDLQTWIPLQTNLLGSGPLYFSDSQSSANPRRFYRAQLLPAFTVGGTLTGLPAGDTVTLHNGSDNLTLSANGPFTFPTALPDGHAYSITVSGIYFGGLTPTTCTLTNGSGTISGANVTNVAAQCAYTGDCPPLTGNKDIDMLNAAVSDGTANGGVPAVMLTENGGRFRVTALSECSYNVALFYPEWAKFTTVVGSTSCSSTTFPSGTEVIQFGTALVCQPDELYGYWSNRPPFHPTNRTQRNFMKTKIQNLKPLQNDSGRRCSVRPVAGNAGFRSRKIEAQPRHYTFCRRLNLFIALFVLALPALVQAQFTFTTNNGAITITGYNTAAGLDVVIPAMTNGYPVTSIGDYAFNGSGITNVTIPNSVTSIGALAFASCTSLTSINVDAANPAYSSLGGVLFDKSQAILLQFPGGLHGSYTIPNSVTNLGPYAFGYGSRLV